ESRKNQISLVGCFIHVLVRHPTVCHTDNAKTFPAEILESLLATRAGSIIHRMLDTVCFIGYRPLQNAFRSPFRDQEAAAAIFGHDRNHAPFEIKRNLAYLPVFAYIGLVMAENGAIQWVPCINLLQRLVNWIGNARLKGTVEIRVAKALFVWSTERIHMLLQ